MKNPQHHQLNRRTGNERRHYVTELGFPFVDSHGQLVTEDRRKLADRRTSYGNVLPTPGHPRIIDVG